MLGVLHGRSEEKILISNFSSMSRAGLVRLAATFVRIDERSNRVRLFTRSRPQQPEETEVNRPAHAARAHFLLQSGARMPVL